MSQEGPRALPKLPRGRAHNWYYGPCPNGQKSPCYSVLILHFFQKALPRPNREGPEGRGEGNEGSSAFIFRPRRFFLGVSFDFGPEGYVCISVETRMTNGQAYSALAGLYRQFELYYVMGDERDIVRLRTNPGLSAMA